MKKKVIYSNNPKIRLPYVLFIPKEYNKKSNIIVELKTPSVVRKKVPDIINEMTENEFNTTRMDLLLYMLLEKLPNSFILLPIIPRVEGFYTTFLGSKIINNDFSDAPNLTKEEKELLSSIDVQVKEMILEVSNKYGISSKAIMKGYSATANFATNFSILHPEVVSYNISGGTAGLSCLPINKYNGITLPYPIGTTNIDFNLEEYKYVKHFFYMGKDDINTPALPLCEISLKKDVNGNPLPKRNENGEIIYKYDKDGLLLPYYKECYTKEEINAIHDLYGDENLERFKINAKIFEELKVNCVHKLYEGDHNTIFNNAIETMLDDIVSFFYFEKQKERKIS